MSELPKVFNHAEVDPKWYAFWEKIGAFTADPSSGREPFSMVIPPPNVTGSLHIGHALNHTLPDRAPQPHCLAQLPCMPHRALSERARAWVARTVQTPRH